MIGVEDVVVFFKLVILVEVGANNLVIGRGVMILFYDEEERLKGPAIQLALVYFPLYSNEALFSFISSYNT